ncbi:Uu.00g064070.m01.CDS01 [Anthostomella pinea]|uniref:Uu.00g064070.m01.CDS01 n=1 Tax=Anthostomella pinea TaxID=933095 RepID=A0AAI8VTG5_9PEZI|nr:Uu.00g064070.m01.CDS01 [Anthostomella pinea]
MQITAVLVAVLATAVLAKPARPGVPVPVVDKTRRDATVAAPPVPSGGPYAACTGLLYSSLQCCATDVLGVADLDCGTPSAVPTSPENFEAICAAGGQIARCCILPVLGQSVLCETPVGL